MPVKVSKRSKLIYVNKDKCVNCYSCISVCPVKYCNDCSETHIQLNANMCIGCGSCIQACPHEARYYNDDLENFLYDLNSNKTIAVVAPSAAANFKDELLHLNGWLKAAGVMACFDVSFGGELCAMSYAEYIRENNPETLIAQPCPAIVDYIRVFKPELLKYLAPIDSPLGHLVKFIRKHYPQYGDHRIAFISPCLSKKREIHDAGLADYNITFKSIDAFLKINSMKLSEHHAVEFENPAPGEAVVLPEPGGLLRAIEKHLPEMRGMTRTISGSENVYAYLDNLEKSIKAGRAPRLIDCLSCIDGCCSGPGVIKSGDTPDEVKYWLDKRHAEALRHYDDGRSGSLNAILAEYHDAELFRCEHTDMSGNNQLKTPDQMEKEHILYSMNKFSEEDQFNCSSCGYGTCQNMIKAIFNGLNRPENCHHFLISEMKNARMKIKEEEETLRKILLTSVEGFVQLDSNNIIARTNQSMAKLLHITVDELKGKSLFSLLDAKNADIAMEQLKLRLRGYSSSYEIELMPPGGQARVVCHFNATPLFDENREYQGSFAMVSDITERKKAEEELREYRTHLEDLIRERTKELIDNNRMLEMEINARKKIESALRESEGRAKGLLNTIHTGIVLIDCQSEIIIEMNNIAAEMLKTKVAEVIGKPYFRFFQCAGSSGGKVSNCQNHTHECRLVDVEGNVVPVLKTSVKVSMNGRNCMLQSFIDITRQKEVEDGLRKAKAGAEHATRSKSMFLANMSHEIRTPLNAIIGMSDLLLNSKLDKLQQEHTSIIHEAGNHLLSVINDILDFSKIEAGKLEFDNIDFPLLKCVEEVGDIIGTKANDKGLELIIDFDPVLPTMLKGDPMRLRQILVNLCNNAIKFTEKGLVKVKVSTESMLDNKVSIRFSVIDSGIGIPADRLDRLFKSFSQIDASTTREYGGTGLGLAICKQLVEMMGGNITVESKVDKGSTFSFHAVWELVKIHPEPHDVSAGDISGKRIMVIDDVYESCEYLRTRLESYGCFVSCFTQPLEALETLHMDAESGEPFDLVMMDYQMPVMDGISLARYIKADGKLKDIPLALMSSIPEANISSIDELGFNAFILKPLKQSNLYNTVVEAFSARHSGRNDKTIARECNLMLSEADSHKVKILVVEDNPVNRKVASSILGRLGLSCDLATDGLNALDILRHNHYDIILMDCQMPKLDGYETTRKIRGREKTSNSPPTLIIAMTANALKGDREKCMNAGMNDYISKPVNVDNMHKTLSKYLKDIIGENQDVSTPVPDDAPAPKNPPAQPDADTSPVLQPKTLDAVTGGDDMLRQEIVNLFYEACDANLEESRRCMDTDDFSQLHKEAHSLKGASGNIGAIKMYNTSVKLMAAADENDKPLCETLFTQLKNQYEEVKTLL